jgi:5-methylcytosine-specific restriction protein B
MEDMSESDEVPVFHLTRGGCSGTGVRTADGFLVHAGAVGRGATVRSFPDGWRNLRDQLLDDGTLQFDGERVVLSADHQFGSPSAAAAALMGRNASGNLEWKHESGLTLGEFERGEADAPERSLRRRWYEVHLERRLADPLGQREGDSYEQLKELGPRVFELVAELDRTGDIEQFRDEMQTWSVQPGTGYNGFGGQMMINQLAKRSEDPVVLGGLLVEAFAVPATDDEALAKIARVVDYVESIRVGAHPGPGHVPFMLSFIWALADRTRWPVMWAKSVAFVETATGVPFPADPSQRYHTLLERIRELTIDLEEFERTASWWQDQRPVFIDEVLCDRAAFNLEREASSEDEQAANARALVGVATYLGKELVDEVSVATGGPRTLPA